MSQQTGRIICPEEVRRLCNYGLVCNTRHNVPAGSDCAEYIRAVLNGGQEPAQDVQDAQEMAYLAEEREAIQAETATPSGWLSVWKDVDGWENKQLVSMCPRCGWTSRAHTVAFYIFCPMCGREMTEQRDGPDPLAYRYSP